MLEAACAVLLKDAQQAQLKKWQNECEVTNLMYVSNTNSPTFQDDGNHENSSYCTVKCMTKVKIVPNVYV